MSGTNPLPSLAGYDLSPGSEVDETHEDFHKLTGNISGSDDEGSNASQPLSRTYSPVVHDDGPPVKKKPPVSGLVSAYHDDDESGREDNVSNDDVDDDAVSAHSSHSQMAVDESAKSTPATDADEEVISNAQPEPIIVAEGVQLPPSPTSRCSRATLDKINKMHQRMKYSNYNLDAVLQQDKLFRNPSIYEKLIDMVDIDEKGTNYPPELYDPSIWGKASYYDELSKQQEIEMEKRRKEKKEKSKIDFVSAAKPAEGATGSGQRKSKWDTGASAQPALNNLPAVGSLIKKK